MRPSHRWNPSLTAIGAAGIHPRWMPPDGQITEMPVQPLLKKYSDFPKTQITFITLPSRPTEGRLAIVTDAGRDAVDADVPSTNGA